MFVKKIYKAREISYACLTFLSTLVPLAVEASEALLEDKKYNIIGVALFSGRDPISRGIKAWTKSNVSHVGVILSEQNNENKWHCFESTGSVSEVLSGQYPHVRLTPWETVVREYDGTVNYRLFVFHYENRTNPEWVTGFVKDYNRKPYTKNPFKLLKALFRRNSHSNSLVLKTAFCSELTAKMLMDCRIAPLGIAANYLPADFSSERQLRLEPGIELVSDEFFAAQN
ncbi:MAG: hypothetical protein K0R76_1059 [Alphaproteobacteria bacterium]|nr:hypothetical protein [Alphaproteobacteria bacterium]MDF3034105.1 hypothetical protein [Alphaproteobacteria bacterium]